MSLRFRGEELLFAGPDPGGSALPLHTADWPAFKRAAGFKVLGGDKTWVAPQRSWAEDIPPLDLDVAPYTVVLLDRGVRMTSSICRETGLQVRREVVLLGQDKLRLREQIINMSLNTVSWGIWNVTQVPRPFTVWFPCGRKAFRSYYEEDPTLPPCRTTLLERDGWVGVPCVEGELFKFGGNLTQGLCRLVKPCAGGDIIWERTFAVDQGASYAHRATVEVFNTDRYGYGEVEIHSPLAVLPPGKDAILEQTWFFR